MEASPGICVEPVECASGPLVYKRQGEKWRLIWVVLNPKYVNNVMVLSWVLLAWGGVFLGFFVSTSKEASV